LLAEAAGVKLRGSGSGGSGGGGGLPQRRPKLANVRHSLRTYGLRHTAGRSCAWLGARLGQRGAAGLPGRAFSAVGRALLRQDDNGIGDLSLRRGASLAMMTQGLEKANVPASQSLFIKRSQLPANHDDTEKSHGQ